MTKIVVLYTLWADVTGALLVGAHTDNKTKAVLSPTKALDEDPDKKAKITHSDAVKETGDALAEAVNDGDAIVSVGVTDPGDNNASGAVTGISEVVGHADGDGNTIGRSNESVPALADPRKDVTADERSGDHGRGAKHPL